MARNVKLESLRFFVFLVGIAIVVGSSLAIESEADDYIVYTDNSFNWKYTPPEIDPNVYNVSFDQHTHL